MSNATFVVEYARSGRSGCKEKKCQKKLIEKGELRIGKKIPFSLYEDDGTQTEWYHPKCILSKLQRARKTSKHITSKDDLEGFDSISPEDQKKLIDLIDSFNEKASSSAAAPTPTPTPTASSPPQAQTVSSPSKTAKRTRDESPLESSQKNSFAVLLTSENGKTKCLTEPSNFVGRDPFFEIKNKRCSRHQVEIVINKASKERGVNPCCMEKDGNLIVMKRNVEYKAVDGTKFSVLVDKHYFTLKFIDNVNELANNEEKEMTSEQEAKKPKTEEDTRPLCPYGDKCYRKNPAHKKQFRHK